MSDARKIARKLILIADNAPGARALICSILGRSSYEIFEAEDGEEALECARQVQPDLVILDLELPKLDGYSVASRLRSMPPFGDTPILALSAGISQMETRKLIRAGFSSCLEKPISPARLRSAVGVLFNGGRVQEGT